MRHCYVLRVFTRGDDGGNQVGVVPDVTGLDGGAMQGIATANGYSETAYLDWRAGGVPSVRIFTPGRELPFAGAPLVGAAWILGMIGPGTIDRMSCAVGEIPFRIEGDMVWVDTPMADEVTEEPEGAGRAAKAGLPEPEKAWVVKMPLPYLLLDVGSEEAVRAVTPDPDSLNASGADSVYLFARHGDYVTARFFAPDLGIPEDPATGSAAAALAAVLRSRGEESGSLSISQGDEVGHPSTIALSWDSQSARLGGTVRRDAMTIIDR